MGKAIEAFIAMPGEKTPKTLRQLDSTKLIALWNEMAVELNDKHEVPIIYKNTIPNLVHVFEDIPKFVEALATNEWKYFEEYFYVSGRFNTSCVSFNTTLSKKSPISIFKLLEYILNYKK